MNTNTTYYIDEINSNSFLKYPLNCKFSVASFNIQSAAKLTKFNEFKNMIYLIPKMPDIIVIQETWFSKETINLYNIKGYEAVHSCRPDNHGGLSIFIKECLYFNVEVNQLDENMHFLAIKLRSSVQIQPLTIVGFYRPPNIFSHSFLMEVELSSFKYTNIQNQISRPASSTCLDHVLCNFHESLPHIYSIENSLSDHNLILLCLQETSPLKVSRSHFKLCFNYQQIRQDLDSMLSDPSRYLQRNSNTLYNQLEADIKCYKRKLLSKDK